jgi:hypothetical protein
MTILEEVLKTKKSRKKNEKILHVSEENKKTFSLFLLCLKNNTRV